jgi:hypothetical protein
MRAVLYRIILWNGLGGKSLVLSSMDRGARTGRKGSEKLIKDLAAAAEYNS